METTTANTTDDIRIAIYLLRRSNGLYANPIPRFRDSSPAERHLADAHCRLAERLATLAEKVIVEGWQAVKGQFPEIAPQMTVEAVLRNWPDYTREEAEAIVELDMQDWPTFQAAMREAGAA